MYNILEHKQAIAENIQKAFGDTPQDIEKAKWQIGEIRTDSRGIAHECYEYTAEGKPRLRRVKKNKGASTDDSKKQSKKPKIKRVNNIDVYLDIVNEVVDETLKKFPKGSDRTKAMYFAENKLRANTKWMLPFTVVSTYLTEVMSEYGNKTKDDKKEDDTQPQKKGNGEVDNFMKLVQKFSDKYTDESKVTVTKTPKGNWDVSYNGSRLGIINSDQLSEKTAKAKGWLKEEKKKDKAEEKDLAEYAVGDAIRIEGVGTFMKVGRSEWVDYDPNTKQKGSKRFNYTEISDNGYAKNVTDIKIDGKTIKDADKLKEENKKDNKKKEPTKLSECVKGDTVALIYKRSNPQLSGGGYAKITKHTIERVNKATFEVDGKKFYKDSGTIKNSGSDVYGSSDYKIILPSEVSKLVKNGEINGFRINKNDFED